MTASASTTPTTLTALCDALRGRVVDGISVHDAGAEIVPGATGESIVRLTLVLDDPTAGLDTWPHKAIHAIDKFAWDEAGRLGIAEVYMKHRPLSAVESSRRSRHRTSR
jgi:hypothetical protein